MIWNATKNDTDFINEMRMHDETSKWFDTGKMTVYMFMNMIVCKRTHVRNILMYERTLCERTDANK